MRADFLDANRRHFEDAELLYANARWANADHLYGLSAECGLKRLMMLFGMQVKPMEGDPVDNRDRVHANTAWDRYEAYRSGHPAGSRYVLPQNPFLNWDVSQRYAARTSFSEMDADVHRNGASAVRLLVDLAVMEGMIP